MRVLHVIDTLGVGGAEQMLVNLLPALKQQGHDVSVAVLRPLSHCVKRSKIRVCRCAVSNTNPNGRF